MSENWPPSPSLHQAGPISASDRGLASLGREVADQAASQFASRDPRVAAIQLVAKAGLLTADQVADRVFRREGEDLLSARPRAAATLHRLVLQGYLEQRTVAYQLAGANHPGDVGRAVGGVTFERAFSVTRKASREFKVPVPATIRDHFVTHHVKTMEALWRVERDYQARGYQVLSWKGEGELIREQFRGKVFDSRGIMVPKFPDAQLVLRAPDGSTETINVEYVSRSYTNAMIAEKHAAFGATRTVWAVPADSPGTAARVHELTGEEPLRV